MKKVCIAAVLLVILLEAGCQSGRTLLEPQAEEDCLVIGVVELNARNIPSEAGSWLNGTHRKDMKVLFSDPEGKEISVTVNRSDGLFMSRKFKSGTYRITGFFYAIERNNGWVKFPFNAAVPRTINIQNGVVNNIGFMDWRYDGATHYNSVSWGLNYDYVVQTFKDAYAESAWNEYLFTNL